MSHSNSPEDKIEEERLVRVRMRGNAACPEGSLEHGGVYDLPLKRAQPLLDAGAAEIVSSDPSTPQDKPSLPEYPDLFSPKELAEGVELWDWAERCDPEAAAQIKGNWVPVFYVPSDPEQDRQFEIVDAADRRLRERMLASLEAGVISLAIPPASPDELRRPIRPVNYPEVVRGMVIRPISPNTVSFGSTEWEVRIYLNDVAVGDEKHGTAAAETECRRWLRGLRREGPPKKSSKREYRIEAQKKWGNKLSDRGFDRAWANAVGDDPKWTKPGRKPKKTTT